MASPPTSPDEPKTVRRTLSLGDFPIEKPSRPQSAMVTTRLHSQAQSPVLGDISTPLDLDVVTLASVGKAGDAGAIEPQTAELATPSTTSPVQEAEVDAGRAQNQTQRTVSPSGMTRYARIMRFVGRGNGASRHRKSLVDFIFSISWGFVQVVVIITMLAIATHTASPTVPGVTEWVGCSKPLGVWNCVWIARVVFSRYLTYYGWKRGRRIARQDAEAANTANNLEENQPAAVPAAGFTPPDTEGQTLPAAQVNTQSEVSRFIPRLILLLTLITMTWFVVANNMVYASVNTCRHSSPHLWWLSVGILCTLYIMVLEVLGIIIINLIIVIFFNPGKPDIGKMPRTHVERIPLVFFIPSPPEDEDKPFAVPKPSYSYPPKPAAPPPEPRRRFAFLPKYKKRKDKSAEAAAPPDETKERNEVMSKDVEGEETWEDQWEKCDYPFVRLDENRATCAICMLDFEPPPKKGTAQTPVGVEGGSSAAPEITAREVEHETNEAGDLILTDAGEGAQPLRLLQCGHVFHKTCLDPWLTDVSGRCPVCQDAVVIEGVKRKQRRRRRN